MCERADLHGVRSGFTVVGEGHCGNASEFTEDEPAQRRLALPGEPSQSSARAEANRLAPPGLALLLPPLHFTLSVLSLSLLTRRSMLTVNPAEGSGGGAGRLNLF